MNILQFLDISSVFWRASSLLEKMQSDSFFDDLYKTKQRIQFLLHQFPEIIWWSNLESNWLLVKVNEIVMLDICPFFYFSEFMVKQYCCLPQHNQQHELDLELKARRRRNTYIMQECTCDLLQLDYRSQCIIRKQKSCF